MSLHWVGVTSLRVIPLPGLPRGQFMFSEFVLRQGDKGAGSGVVESFAEPAQVCLHWLGPQGVCVSLARPAQLPKQRDGAPASGSFVGPAQVPRHWDGAPTSGLV